MFCCKAWDKTGGLDLEEMGLWSTSSVSLYVSLACESSVLSGMPVHIGGWNNRMRRGEEA